MGFEEFLHTKHFGPSIFRPYADFLAAVGDTFDYLLGANPTFGKSAVRLIDRDIVLAHGKSISLLAVSSGMLRHLPTRQFCEYDNLFTVPEAAILTDYPPDRLPVLLPDSFGEQLFKPFGLDRPRVFLLPNGYENTIQGSPEFAKSREHVAYGLLEQTLAQQLSPLRSSNVKPPASLADSLSRFRADHPDVAKAAFIMMRFGRSTAHERIVESIRNALKPFGIVALRADDKQYHDDLLPNILTYLYGCGFGIAVFERIEADEFNPNVALEVGYSLALDKPVCFLKDRTLRTLPTDLVGKLYREFDPQHPEETIATQLVSWLNDKHLVPAG